MLDIAAARPDVSFFNLCENNLSLVMAGSNIKVTDSDVAVCLFQNQRTLLRTIKNPNAFLDGNHQGYHVYIPPTLRYAGARS